MIFKNEKRHYLLIAMAVTMIICFLEVYRLTKGQVVDKGLSVKEITNSDISLSLQKRNVWSFTRVSVFGGILLAAAALTNQAWAPIVCVTIGPTCWVLAIGTTLLAAVVAVAVGIEFFRGSEKRDFNDLPHYLSNGVDDINNFVNDNSHRFNLFIDANLITDRHSIYHDFEHTKAIIGKFHDSGLGAPIILNSSLIGNFSNAPNNRVLNVHWLNDLGKHTSSFMNHYNLDQMVEDIINQHSSGYNSTDRYVRSSDKLSKRTSTYNVDWISYGVDNENTSLESKLSNEDQSESDWDDQMASAMFGTNLHETWKWCGTIMASDDESYNSFGNADATHGEIYTNQYGGIDGYCNDNKGGAQCGTTGCQ